MSLGSDFLAELNAGDDTPGTVRYTAVRTLQDELVRPVEKRQPLSIALEATDIGRFTGHLDLPERGNWDLDVVVERDGERYALTRRMFLK